MNMCSNEYVLTMTTTNNNDRKQLTRNSYTINDVTTNFQQESTTQVFRNLMLILNIYHQGVVVTSDKNVTLGFELMIDGDGPKNLFRV